MKSSLALLSGLLLAVSLPAANGQQTARDFASQMAVDADTQERFFAKYPDLADERPLVAAAARQVAGQPGLRERASLEEAIADRARAVLAERTPQEWQRKAVSLYPELGVAGSEFNRLFLRRYEELKTSSPQFEQEPSWPVLLAKRCADELRARTAPTGSSASAAPPIAAAPAADAAMPPAPRPGQNRWLSALSIVLLAGILWLPARWLFRISGAFAGGEGAVTLWQRALRPAAWTYLGAALLALFRTFRANADLGFVDRFGITLLVSLLVGFALAPIAFAIGWAVIWWRRREAARAEAMRFGANDAAEKGGPAVEKSRNA